MVSLRPGDVSPGADEVSPGVDEVSLRPDEVSLGANGTPGERIALPGQGQPQTCTENNLLVSPLVSEPLESSRAKIGQVLSNDNLLLE